MKSLIKNVLATAGMHISSIETHKSILAESNSAHELLELYLESYTSPTEAKSQLGQDILALYVNKFKREGFFVEFGATNGFDLSNSYLLEKHFAWNGILAEPMVRWHEDLKRNRNCKIDTRCVWSSSGQILEFLDVEAGEFSTVKSLADSDHNSNIRENSNIVNVETVSLLDLLKEHNAPENIDYLSIDTEGSEYEILKGFNFNNYKFNFISIEHNFTKNRNLIQCLLKKEGYRQILPGMSKWDDWFIPSP
jgi:FkbM family methyltransferase